MAHLKKLQGPTGKPLNMQQKQVVSVYLTWTCCHR